MPLKCEGSVSLNLRSQPSTSFEVSLAAHFFCWGFLSPCTTVLGFFSPTNPRISKATSTCSGFRVKNKSGGREKGEFEQLHSTVR